MESRENLHDEKFVQCYVKYSMAVAWYLRKNFIGNFAEAREMSHDIFVKLYEQDVNLDPGRKGMYAFLVRIARNHAIDVFRKKKTRELASRNVRFEDVVPNDQLYANLEDAYIEGEVVSTLHDAIGSFSQEKEITYIKSVMRGKSKAGIMRDSGWNWYELKRIESSVKEKIRERMLVFFEE